MTTEYHELLTLCGFEPDEIQQQRHRIETTFQRLNLVAGDMDRAVSRLRTYFDIELKGVRKVLGTWLKELIDLVMARDEGKKLIYYGYPPFQYMGLVIKKASEAVGDFYIACPEVILCETLGQIFGKLNPVLEAGEAGGLAPGHAMCSLLQIKDGALSLGFIPAPDLSISTSYFCDMGPKADELMQYKHGGYPVEFVDSCMDSPWGEWPAYDPQRIHYLGQQLEQLFSALQDRFGFTIDETIWTEARKLAGPLYAATFRLNKSLTADPLPLGAADAQLILNLPMGCTGIALKEGAEAIEIMAEELEKRVETGVGVLPKNAPRVLMGFPSFVDPALNRLIQDVGLAVPVHTTLLTPPPLPESPKTYKTLGEKRSVVAMHGGLYHSSFGWIGRIKRGLDYTDLDGFLYTYQYSCRPLTCNSKLMKEYVEKEIKLPTLLLDMDMYDDRNYSAGALQTRLEAFAEMLKTKKK
ncbi:MAG: 2-hydroxyacyl-CoA dehydratase family protein [Thermodesulfobacteriota bacterium]